MIHYLIDTCVIVDVLSVDPRWATWSATTLRRCAEDGELVINPIIYAELGVAFGSIEALDGSVPPEVWRRLPLPYAAGFLAGRCFLEYRRRGGRRSAPLPDFYIGAHAATEGLTLVTRDAARYRTYFPRLLMVTPEEGG